MVRGERGPRLDEKEVPADGATCPWCSAPNPSDATACVACGAALAQRDSLGDVAIPGLTSVDPGLAAYAGRPMRLRGPSPSQGMAGGATMAAALGGPAGLAALGGLGLVAAAEYLGAAGTGAAAVDPATVGELTGLERMALEAAARSVSETADGEADDKPSSNADA